jgi:hypothetical protein
MLWSRGKLTGGGRLWTDRGPRGPSGPDPTALVLEIDTTQAGSASNTFVLPAGDIGTYNATIDWGDGSTSTITAYDDADLTHAYAVEGVYLVQITGDFPQPYFNNTGDRAKVLSVDFGDGSVGITSLNRSFFGCLNITLVNGKIPATVTGSGLIACFRDTKSLTTIQSGLFDNCTQVTAFQECFRSSALESIPAGLFDNCTQVTTFLYCFQGCDFTEIPEGLFDNCPLVNNFQSCFGFTLINAIPAGLFDNCPLVTTFSGCFYACTGLNNNPSAFPADLFRYNPLVVSFVSCFNPVTLDTGLYNDLLASLETYNPNDNVPFHGGNSTHSGLGTLARNNLTGRGWTITDGGAA